MTGGEAFYRLLDEEFFTEPQAAAIIRPVIDAIRYCHEMGICHRDLKLENILHSNKEEDSIIKITDFSLARILPDEVFAMTACGTPGYVAPEILEGNGYGKKVDYWSIGVILYTLLCGYKPFECENDEDLFAKIKKGDYSFPDAEWAHISDIAKDLIVNLLQTDPN
jgi:calcium/calmodulin-dependent protein kinase I